MHRQRPRRAVTAHAPRKLGTLPLGVTGPLTTFPGTYSCMAACAAPKAATCAHASALGRGQTASRPCTPLLPDVAGERG